jgi:thymidylate synthase (FAD)
MIDPLNDGISKVELIDSMGNDLHVVNAARVSMAKESEWDWKKDEDDMGMFWEHVLSEKDTKLVNYLAKHGHWTPFSHVMVTLRIKMPIFVARQWFKHTVGFTRNEVSRRYVDDAPEFYRPIEWRRRAENVKQGSGEVIEHMTGWAQSGTRSEREAVKDYEYLLEMEVCPEQARMVLPHSMYTEFFETASLAAYARLCKLRLDPHAQKETQLYAQAVDDVVKEVAPVSWQALMDN